MKPHIYRDCPVIEEGDIAPVDAPFEDETEDWELVCPVCRYLFDFEEKSGQDRFLEGVSTTLALFDEVLSALIRGKTHLDIFRGIVAGNEIHAEGDPDPGPDFIREIPVRMISSFPPFARPCDTCGERPISHIVVLDEDAWECVNGHTYYTAIQCTPMPWLI